MPDATQEFSVQTSNYNAEFGQSAGAVVNIVTKSGGEQFHGDLFEYLRNGFFNAENHFSSVGLAGHAAPASVRRRHRRTGEDSAHLQRQDHAVLLRLSVHPDPPGRQRGLVHSAHRRRGRHHRTPATPITATSAPATGSSMGRASAELRPASRSPTRTPAWHGPTTTSPPAPSIRPRSTSRSFSQWRAPDAAAGKIGNTVNYFSATQNYFNEHTARVDHSFGANDHLFGRYFYDWYHQPGIFNPTNLYSYTSYFQTRYQNALIAETHTFTPNILNNLVLNYQREVSQRGGPPGSSDITSLGPSGSGLASIWQPNLGPYMALSVSGYMKVGSSASALFERNNYTFNDDLHWVNGAHDFAFGGHYELSKFDVVNVYNSYGAFTSGLAGASLRHRQHQRHGQFPAGLPIRTRPGRIRGYQRPRSLPGHLRTGQLEGQSPPDPGLWPALGDCLLPGTPRSASRPHSAPPSMRPTPARLSSRLPRQREQRDCLPAWCSRVTRASRSTA